MKIRLPKNDMTTRDIQDSINDMREKRYCAIDRYSRHSESSNRFTLNVCGACVLIMAILLLIASYFATSSPAK